MAEKGHNYFFGGTLSMPWHIDRSKCRVKDCYKYVKASGLCGMHYERKRITGSLKPGKRGPRLSSGIAVAHMVIADYKRGAERRGLEFSLSDGYTEAMLRNNCFYCGVEPQKTRSSTDTYGVFKYNGIDRADSTKGYVMGNVVPCCQRCNMMKGNMNQQDFIGHIRKILFRQRN